MSHMMRCDVNAYLSKQSLEDIVQACDDICVYRYKTGILPENSVIKKFGDELDYADYRDICEAVEEYVSERFKNIVVLCMREMPFKYIQF